MLDEPLRVRFAAFRPPKHDPGREIVREVLKTMNQAGGREQDVADTKRLALKRGFRLTDRKHALARHDDVMLVLIVRGLFIPAPGEPSNAPLLSLSPRRRFPRPTPERAVVAFSSTRRRNSRNRFRGTATSGKLY